MNRSILSYKLAINVLTYQKTQENCKSTTSFQKKIFFYMLQFYLKKLGLKKKKYFLSVIKKKYKFNECVKTICCFQNFFIIVEISLIL